MIKFKFAGFAALALASMTAASNAAIVINEVYAGGGSTSASAAYQTDFIELFNSGTESVNLSGFRLDYASSSRANGVFDIPVGTLPTGASIAPLGTYLVQTGSAGTGGAADPAADARFGFVNGVSGASLSNTSGSIRLQDASANTLDILGYGNLTNGNFETTPETTPASVAVSMQRVGGVDTNDNQLDFIQATPTPVASAVVPEPTTLAALGGVALLGMARRRR